MDQLTLISDVNISILGRYLSNMEELSGVQVNTAPFGQIFQTLLASDTDDTKKSVVLVWTHPEFVLETYRDVFFYKSVDHGLVLDELDQYIDAIRVKASRVKYLLHPSWIVPPGERGYGMLDYTKGLGLSHLVARLNLSICDRLANLSNVHILNAEHWIRAGGIGSAPEKMWFASKVRYSNAVYQSAAKDIEAALQGLAGKARKLLLLDLDNTLWGGVVGETGWPGIRLGGHDHIGEAFVYFQQRLKALTEKGVQLGIVSKNDESVALEAIDRHPEMQLRRGDFADWRINWLDKAKNIIDLVDGLRLGLDSVVFVDDNITERARVREALGDKVLVPDWPNDPTVFGKTVSELTCFDTPSLSAEDRDRAKIYANERQRRVSRKEIDSLDDWLASLKMTVTLESLNQSNLPRAAQLLNKTNQMNMRTRRLSEDELKEWAAGENRSLWTFRLSDRFGDSGLCSIISVEIAQNVAHIVDFVMSCRVMGRKLENVMIHLVVEHAKQIKNLKEILAEYIETERNRPCLEYWRSSGFEEREENRFFWDAAREYPMPDFIRLIETKEE